MAARVRYIVVTFTPNSASCFAAVLVEPAAAMLARALHLFAAGAGPRRTGVRKRRRCLQSR
ncbi:MAG TPA: hypothetical protein VNF03_13710, partial [Patescibacteria group bacterium]|nr:hypothetical protein [Patescibacteria group bacterium]